MVFIGYHASHEQVPPSVLLKSVVRAERAGFDGAMCSDHLAPWSVEVIRELLNGREVTRTGDIEVHRARVWSRPETPPPLLGAAVTSETAAWVAGWADGLATVAQPRQTLERVLAAYGESGGRGPRVLQVHVAMDETEEAALKKVREQWRHSAISGSLWDIEQPEDFDALAGNPSDEQLRRGALVSDDANELAERVADLVGLGFDRVYIHGISDDQNAFLDHAEDQLLPALRRLL